jgi:hypothetical protein
LIGDLAAGASMRRRAGITIWHKSSASDDIFLVKLVRPRMQQER